MNDRLLPGDNAARARYATLINALGGEPVSEFQRAVLARLSAWTDQPDIDALAHLIHEQVNRRLGPLLELAPLVRASREITIQDNVIVAIPEPLAGEIILAASGQEGAS
jgi:hypothetical protein